MTEFDCLPYITSNGVCPTCNGKGINSHGMILLGTNHTVLKLTHLEICVLYNCTDVDKLEVL